MYKTFLVASEVVSIKKSNKKGSLKIRNIGNILSGPFKKIN